MFKLCMIMEQKLVKVPFDVEMAKKITKGEEEGRIVTRNGRNARIICWDAKCDDNIVALIEDEKGVEFPKSYVSDGLAFLTGESDCDLMLEIPEYMTFKDGDVLSYDGGTFILKRIDGKDRAEYYANFYGIYTAFDSACLMKNLVNHLRVATEEERKIFINALKESKRPEAKKYLKHFFGIEEKPECEFKPFDKVLVRCHDESQWCARFFDRMFKGNYACTDSLRYKQCIPYNEQTKHLLGTTDNWEG